MITSGTNQFDNLLESFESSNFKQYDLSTSKICKTKMYLKNEKMGKLYKKLVNVLKKIEDGKEYKFMKLMSQQKLRADFVDVVNQSFFKIISMEKKIVTSIINMMIKIQKTIKKNDNNKETENSESEDEDQGEDGDSLENSFEVYDSDDDSTEY